MSADGYPSGRIFRTDIMIICHQNIWTDYDEFKLFGRILYGLIRDVVARCVAIFFTGRDESSLS